MKGDLPVNRRLAVFCAVMISLFVVLSPGFTGWLTTTDVIHIGFSVGNKTMLCLNMLEIPDTVIEYQSSSFKVFVENCGNVPASGKVHFYVMDLNNNTAVHFESEIPELNITESAEVERSWTANFGTGRFWVSARNDINNKTTSEINSSDTFEIISSTCVPGELRCFGRLLKRCSMYGTGWDTVMTCNYGCANGQCIPGGGAPAGPPPPSEPVPDFSVEYSGNITLNPDMSYALVFRVVNTGGVDLKDMSLQLSSEDIKTEITSQTVSLLPTGDSAILMGEIYVPENTGEGEYSVAWKMKTERMEKSGTIPVNVTVSSMKYKSAQLISYYGYLIEYIDEDIEEAERNGKNVTLPRKHSEEARYELGIAKEMHKLGLYEEAVNQLEVVRRRIGDMITSLIRAKFRAEPEKPPEPVPIKIEINLLLLMAVIIIIGVIILVFYRRYKKRRLLMSPGRWEPSKIRI